MSNAIRDVPKQLTRKRRSRYERCVKRGRRGNLQRRAKRQRLSGFTGFQPTSHGRAAKQLRSMCEKSCGSTCKNVNQATAAEPLDLAFKLEAAASG